MDWLISITSFAGGALGAGVLSFAREKGKNRALKSDIGKITEIVEGIKSTYSKENEEVRAQLSLLVSKQNSLHEDMKRAIFEFWDNMTSLIIHCDYTRSEIDDEHVSDLKHYQSEIEKIENELVLKHARLFFLVQDSKLIELSNELFRDATRFAGKFGVFLIKAQPWLEKMAEMHNRANWDQTEYQGYWQKVNEEEKNFDKETEEISETLDKNIELFKELAHALLTK